MKIVAIEKSNEFQFLDTQSYFEYIKILKKEIHMFEEKNSQKRSSIRIWFLFEKCL